MTLFGIRIRLHILSPLIFLLLSAFSGVREAVSMLTVLSVHELSHLLAAVLLHVRVDEIERMTGEIEQRYPQTVEEYKNRLRAAVEEMVSNNVDENRLLMEVAVMADRSAIAEETVRLRSHIRQLRDYFESAEPIGRRIDFIVQELNREVNTISSKSQDIPITKLAVDAKAEIEKLREQLQNIE